MSRMLLDETRSEVLSQRSRRAKLTAAAKKREKQQQQQQEKFNEKEEVSGHTRVLEIEGGVCPSDCIIELTGTHTRPRRLMIQ